MLLGSPPGLAQQQQSQQQIQSPYLPAYLMGDTSVIASPSSRPWSSPPKSHLNRSLSTGLGSNTSGFLCNTPRTRDANRFKEKPGAPPVHGLIESVSGAGPSAVSTRLDDLNRSDVCSTPLSQTSNYRHRVPGSAGPNALFSQSYGPINSPAQIDPFYSQGESIGIDEQLDETWVTVFGFPPAATSYILQEFSQYGNIIKHVVAADGNWLHIHYQSKLQAKKALSKNGKVFGGSIMIGVVPCIDKSVMEYSDKENNTSFLAAQQSSFLSPADDCRLRLAGKPTSIRPLTGSFKAHSNDTEVLQQSAMPRRNNGLISKAVEYMFGW
jgi:nuclear pore complex protein Nup53